jgi:hypothetical protein
LQPLVFKSNPSQRLNNTYITDSQMTPFTAVET